MVKNIGDTVFVLEETNSANTLIAKEIRIIDVFESYYHLWRCMERPDAYYTLKNNVTFRMPAEYHTIRDGENARWFSLTRNGIEDVARKIDTHRINDRKSKINEILNVISQKPLLGEEADSLINNIIDLTREIAKITANKLVVVNDEQ